jgi:hypothetical protein
LTTLKDASNFSTALSFTNLNYFEDSRSWAMKKMYFGLNSSSYSLSYDNLTTKEALSYKDSSVSSLASAYLLDYNLSYSSISVNSTLSTLPVNNITQYSNLFSLDNTLYQDSYNNYAFSLSSTSTTTNLNNFRHRRSSLNNFTSNLS